MFVAFMALLTCSCSSRPTVHPTSGTVTFQGKPAVKAIVILRPETTEPSTPPIPHGEVGPDGAFHIGTYADSDGAPAGNYTVTITWPETRKDPVTHDDVTEDRLQGRYRDPAKSTWQVTIKPGDNELPPFRLE